MENSVKVNRDEVELSQDLLISFVKALSPEISKFYQSDEGNAYFEKWMEQHPEYAA